MPRLVPFRLVAACALALLLLLSTAALAAGKGTRVSVRVVGRGGKALGEEFVNAKTTSIKTSPKATCLGGGTGGSGKSVQVKGPTALGALSQASKMTPALRPLLVTDHFLSEFGLGLCGIGKSADDQEALLVPQGQPQEPQQGRRTGQAAQGGRSALGVGAIPLSRRALAASRRTKRNRTSRSR